MKTGISTIALRHLDVFQAIDLAEDAGFQAIEVWGRAPHTPDEFDEKHTLAVRDRILGKGMEPTVFGSYVRSGAEGFQETAAMGLRVAETLGSTIIRVWAGQTEPPSATEEDWRRSAEDLRWMCERAADKGMVLAMEMHCGTLALTPEGTLRLIELAGVDNLKLNYQIANPGEPDFERGVSLVGDHVAMVHAQNFVPSPEGSQHAWDRALIEDGLADYAQLIRLLKPHGFDGCVEVEFLKYEPDTDLMIGAMKKDAAYLRKITSEA